MPRLRDAQWFWAVIRHYLPLYKHVLLACLVVNILTLAMPLFVMNVYDRVIPNKAVETLWVLALGAMLAFGMDFILRNTRTYFVDLAGRNADVVLLGRFMDVLLDMRFGGAQQSMGGLVSQVREFEQLREFFSSTTLLTLLDAPFVLIFLALIYILGGPLVFIPLLTLPCMVLFAYVLQEPFRRSAEAQNRQNSRKNALLVEIAAGLETIKASQMQPFLSRHWDRVVDEGARATAEARRLGALAAHASLFINVSLSLLLVVCGAYRIFEGQLSMGGLIACVILQGRVMAPLMQLATLFTQWQRACVALRVLTRFMESPLENPADVAPLREQAASSPRADSALVSPHFTLEEEGQAEMRDRAVDVPARSLLVADLRADKVFFRYPGQDGHTWALEDVSLSIKQGERVGIVGATGSGKSTLARLCMGLYQPMQGRMLLGDVDMTRLPMKAVRSRMGFLPQEICLFSGTLRDNLLMAWPAPPTEEELLEAAEVAGVLDFARLHPLGLDMPLGERGVGLSGGQAQALALARALARKPEILILDEPSSNLDVEAESRLCQRLRVTLPGRTLILLTHRLSLLEMVDRVIVLDKGRLTQDGPISAVVRKG